LNFGAAKHQLALPAQAVTVFSSGASESGNRTLDHLKEKSSESIEACESGIVGLGKIEQKRPLGGGSYHTGLSRSN
jgi:hypothetical protein